MGWRMAWVWWAAGGVWGISVATAQAQDTTVHVIPTATGAETGRTRATVLGRKITLRLEHVRLEQALETIALAARVRLAYSQDQVPLDKSVSLVVDTITVGDALTVLLRDTGVEAVVSLGGRVSLQRADVSAGTTRVGERQQGTGVISGRVTDAANGSPLDAVAVAVVGTDWRAVTGLDGSFAFRRVPAGAQVLTFRRLGYTPGRRGVDVVGDSTVQVDFVLARSPQRLDEVVVTRTGDQSQRSIGNYITTIAADSAVALQPVQQLSDVFNARAAGVQVFNDGGLTGQTPQINIRGQNSATLSNQPVMYVDGVRIDNGAGQDLKTGRYNDLLPSEIESIEVIRGPAAAALYGTDAATGILLITTKKGVAGLPRWTFTAENGLLTVDRNRFKQSYFAWGHPPGGGTEGQCTVGMVVAGQCAIDSVTSFTPLRDPLQTPIGNGYRQNYVAQVSGGSSTIRYFTSATTELETGFLKLPSAERAQVEILPGGLHAVARPNVLQKVGLRQSITAALSDRADFVVAAGYIDNRNRLPSTGSLDDGQIGPGYQDANNGWAFGLTPASLFENRIQDHAQHLTVSATANWHPSATISSHVTLGLDHSNDDIRFITYYGQGPFYTGGQGSAADQTTSGDIYTVDAGVTATTAVGSHVVARTSVGSQYARQNSAVVSLFGSPLAPTCGSISCATVVTGSANPGENAILGGYGEERVALNDRFFLAGAVRLDGSNTFGSSYAVAVYPKANASWVVSSEGFWPRQQIVTSLRLRVGYGQSGTQPNAQQGLTTYQYLQLYINGQPVLGATPTQIGNPHLRPERQREYEGGADADLVGGRIHTEFTYYDKLSSDALQTISLGPSVGSPSITENIGSMRNQGIEAALNATVVTSREVRLVVGMNGSLNRNVLVSLGPGVQPQYNPYGFGSIVPGYPIFGIFDHRYRYQDLNHDGIIETNELTIDPAVSYLGASYPRSQLSFTGTLTTLNDHVRLNIQVDHRDGSISEYADEASRCALGYCRAVTDLHSPLSDQAAALAYTTSGTVTGYEENGAFTRLREIALTAALPNRLARLARVRSVDLTLAGRNLALWTQFRGVDPEESTPVNIQNPSNGAYTDGGIPAATYWILRLHLGL